MQRGEGSRIRELPAQVLVWPWTVLVVGETKDDRQQSASKSRKHQANMRACFAKFIETCGCASNRSIAKCRVGCLLAYVRINGKRPHGVNVGDWWEAFSARACLQIVRYQDGSAVAGDSDRSPLVVRANSVGPWRISPTTLPTLMLAIVDRSQIVGDAWLWRCDLAVGQVIHRSQIVKVFHGSVS